MLRSFHLGSFAFGIVAALALAFTSCSSSDALHPVSGKVLVNEKPAAGAFLVFHRDGATIHNTPSTATAEADGSFVVSTGDKKGMTAGKYSVTVIWPEPKKLSQGELMMGGNPNDGPDRLKGAYDTPQKTSIHVEIGSGTNELAPFNLK